jgi:hypothetical protein
MHFSLWTCLLRERRRLGLVTFLAFLAGVLFYWPSGLYVGPFHISLVTGTVYALVVGLAAASICLFLPRLRFMIEAVAVSRLLLALSVAVNPQIGPLLLTNPLMMAAVVVAGGACVSRVMHGRIERGAQRRFAVGPTARLAVVAHGAPWQRRFVDWIEGPSVQAAAA